MKIIYWMSQAVAGMAYFGRRTAVTESLFLRNEISIVSDRFLVL